MRVLRLNNLKKDNTVSKKIAYKAVEVVNNSLLPFRFKLLKKCTRK